MKFENLIIRQMRRDELDVLVSWASKEGWNPGFDDADVFWNSDPDGFIAAEFEGELIGGGSIVSYDGVYGFMGFFIMKEEFRGQGLGAKLWFARRDKLKERLNVNAAIGMDGVFNMQPFYSKGGFEFSHREIRFEGLGEAYALSPSLVSLSELPFDSILEYDQKHFPAKREKFLKAWIDQPMSRALGVVKDGELCGYAVIRACEVGYKIGPLFANNSEIANDLLEGLLDHVRGESVFIDVSEINEEAMKMVTEKEMKEVFGCARMYLGEKPLVNNENIYAVTTFELG